MTKTNSTDAPNTPDSVDVHTATLHLPPKQLPQVGKLQTRSDIAVEAQLKIPSERDESVLMTPQAPDPMIKQAAADVANGLQDTSKALETNRTYKKLK